MYGQQKFSVLFTPYSTTFAWHSVSSHRYEAPGDAIEVISPANSPVPAQEKLQAYQQETPKPSQAESEFICRCKYSHNYLAYIYQLHELKISWESLSDTFLTFHKLLLEVCCCSDLWKN